MAFQGQGLEKIKLSALAPISSQQVEKLKKKMTITSRRDYPITTNFPNAIETLIIQQCSLKRIDSRILQLRHLVSLDLCNNHLKSLPGDFDNVPHLSELKLTDNQLEDIPKGFCSGPLSKRLTLLDLSQNSIKVLRPYFCALQALVNLRLDNNELSFLPQAFGTLTSLRALAVTNNKLNTLPMSFTDLRLDTLDLFGNEFLQDGLNTAIDRLQGLTLLELSARAIIKQRYSILIFLFLGGNI